MYGADAGVVAAGLEAYSADVVSDGSSEASAISVGVVAKD